jgi:multidrug efflux system membrane fusion protein
MVALSGCRREEAKAPPAMPPAMVTVEAAAAKDVPVYLEQIGKTTAREYVSIVPQVGGQIEKIHFTDGQELKKGDLLFTIDPRPFEAAVAQAEANLGMRRAELELAKQEFTRVEGLIATKAVSQQDFDTKKNAVAVAEAQIKAGEATVRTAKLSWEYCTIRSPIDGRAGQRQVDVGNVVKPNDQSLLVIQRLDPIYADFTITEADLGRVRQHMADGTLKTQVWIPGEKGEPRGGELTFLDTSVQSGAGTVKLRATLPNADRHFWAGQFVNVRLVLEVKKGAVLVPAQAVQIGQVGPFVYVVNQGTKMSTAEMRPLQQGQRQGTHVVAESGVSAGEQVVTTGQKFLFPGAPVQVAPAPPPAGGPHAPDGKPGEPAPAASQPKANGQGVAKS